MQIEIRKQHFELLSQKAIFWHEKQTLLIGDLHLGKITHFRREGIALPPHAAAENFRKLDELLTITGAERIIFLGDLFHSQYNSEWDTFTLWREKHQPVEMLVVLGNHDILPVSLLLEAGLEVYREAYEEEGFVFTHHPRTELSEDQFVFAGHIHPVFTTYGKGRQRFRLPCFVIDRHQAVLPSFGVFTGGYQVHAMDHRKIFITTETRIYRVA